MALLRRKQQRAGSILGNTPRSQHASNALCTLHSAHCSGIAAEGTHVSCGVGMHSSAKRLCHCFEITRIAGVAELRAARLCQRVGSRRGHLGRCAAEAQAAARRFGGGGRRLRRRRCGNVALSNDAQGFLPNRTLGHLGAYTRGRGLGCGIDQRTHQIAAALALTTSVTPRISLIACSAPCRSLHTAHLRAPCAAWRPLQAFLLLGWTCVVPMTEQTLLLR